MRVKGITDDLITHIVYLQQELHRCSCYRSRESSTRCLKHSSTSVFADDEFLEVRVRISNEVVKPISAGNASPPAVSSITRKKAH